MKVLEIKHLKAYYEKALILRDITIDVESGETVAILGPNGAGKTTILKSIIGLVKNKGTIMFKGKDLTRLKPHDRILKGIAICPEGRRLFPDMTIEDNLKLGARTKNCDTEIEFIYDIFNSDGAFIGRIGFANYGQDVMQMGPLPALSKNDLLYYVREKENGYKELVVYRMRWE